MKISVMGCGRWGTFIAWYLDRIGHEVKLWGRDSSAHLKVLQDTRKNNYLELNKRVCITANIQEAVAHCEIMLISISSQNLRDFAHTLTSYPIDGKTIVLCMKGLENTTGLRLTQVIDEVLGERVKTAVWVGPGHVQDFVADKPNCMVIDSDHSDLKIELVHAFASELIRFYYGTDLIGTEVGAATKNVIGIAAGILDGLNLTSLKGALMARGAREISRLIEAMGGNSMTAYGLAHLGDYEATLFSQNSHNRHYGEVLVTKEPFLHLAEGAETSKALMNLKIKYGVELPISTGVFETIHYGKDPRQVISDLFLRSLKDEFS